MKPETIAKARTMLSSVLLDGLSYREAGAPFGVGRSTVERSIKSLVLEVARERGIPELDEDGLSCLPRLRQFREPVLRAVAAYTPVHPRRKCLTLLEPDEIAAGANRVRLRSENANRGRRADLRAVLHRCQADRDRTARGARLPEQRRVDP